PLLALVTLNAAAPAAAWEPPASDDPAIAAARAWRTAHGPEIVRDYADLLAIPNVARDTENIRRNAEVIRDLLAARGVEAELWTLPDVQEAPPIVYGRLPADAPRSAGEGAPRRTLGIYVHYDGQPVDASRWTATEPWEPRLYTKAIEDGGEPIPLPADGEPIDPEWRIYARGSGDDKAPIPAILAALDALAAAG